MAERSILQLQRERGNQYVQRMVNLARQGDGEAEVHPNVEAAIHRARGGGESLGGPVRGQMESAFGADFSQVRIHTGPESDRLNREVNAVAFTTGQDVFFRHGAYDPGSSAGRELLAHELTHVVQQGGQPVKTKLTVSQPGDAYEREADAMSRAVMQQEQSGASIHRQPEEDKKKLHPFAEGVQRQTDDDKKKLHMQSEAAALGRAAEDDKDKLHPKASGSTISRRAVDSGPLVALAPSAIASNASVKKDAHANAAPISGLLRACACGASSSGGDGERP